MTKKLRLMQAAASALWGPRYRSEMARQLGVSLRTALRWEAGERPVPDIMLARLSKLLQMRQLEISKVLENMPKVQS